MKVLLLLLIGFSGFAAQTRQVNLRGRVLEKAEMAPVPNATIRLAGSSLIATTDAKGEFVLSGSGVGVVPRAGIDSPLRFQGWQLLFPARGGETVTAESFGFNGNRIASRGFPSLPAGVNRLDVLPDEGSAPAFLRLRSGGATWFFKLLSGNTRPVRIAPSASAQAAPAQPSGDAALLPAGALAKAAASQLDVSADLLVAKAVPFASDTGNVGDIVLEYPPRRVDTGAPPVYGAVRLFDGRGDSAAVHAQMDSNWIMWAGPSRKARGLGATPVVWKILRDPEVPGRWTFSECCGVPQGGPEWGYDDLLTKAKFKDYQLHIEFNLMGTPGDENPSGNCNSGVYQQNRYELQIETIPTPWDPKNTHGMGSIINEFAPAANYARPQGKWQAYDITFRNDRYVAGKRTEFARTTIYWNGNLIHDNRKISGAIACCDAGNVPMDSTVQGLKLQNEKGSDVRFRNIWIKPLDIKDTLTRFGY